MSSGGGNEKKPSQQNVSVMGDVTNNGNKKMPTSEMNPLKKIKSPKLKLKKKASCDQILQNSDCSETMDTIDITTMGDVTNNGNKKMPTSEMNPLKKIKSPKMKLKKKASRDQILQNSDRSETMETTDTTTMNEEEKTEKTEKAYDSKIQGPALIHPEAPPTHYTPVEVNVEQATWLNFLAVVFVNRNLVITKVGRPLMTDFMPGDQISSVNAKSIWSIEELTEEVTKNLNPARVTVIRVWNMKCLQKDYLERLIPPPDDAHHYFRVMVYCNEGKGGLKLHSDKKRGILVQHIYANTPVSSVLLVGDQILMINEELLPQPYKNIAVKKEYVYQLVYDSTKNKGCVEITACRKIGARSSPAPSLEAELAVKFPDYAVGVEKGTHVLKKRTDETVHLPLEADVLEIAMRELTFLQQWITPEAEMPPSDKGATLVDKFGHLFDVQPPVEDPTMAQPSESMATTPSKGDTPRKKKKQKQTTTEEPVPEPVPPLIGFEEKLETSSITSDIPEEDELKKATPRAGIASFIRTKWANSPLVKGPPDPPTDPENDLKTHYQKK